MPNSKPIIATITIKGKRWNIDNKLKELNIAQAKPAKIFNKQWPLIMFANSRNDKLTTRKLYETISIKTNNGAIINGAPEGKNNDNIWRPWVLIPI